MKNIVKFFIMKSLAEAAGGGRGTAVRPSSERRRGPESMGDYYRRTGQSALGGNSRTRGKLAPIKEVRRRGQ